MLPNAVRKQADNATRLMSEAAAARGTPPAATPAATPAAAPAAGDAALQKKLDDALEELRKANERAAALDGKLKAEIPRTAAENRQLKEDLKKATTRVTELEGEVKKKVDNMTFTSLNDKERQLAGEDMLLVTGKVAREVVDARMVEVTAPYEKRIASLENRLREAFLLALDQGVPDWEVVNEEPGFIAWLNQVDPSTKRLRIDQIKRAEAASDGPTVVEIMRAYKEGREIGVPKPSNPQAPAQGAPETRIDPGDGGASGAILDEKTADGKRVWSRAAIKAHYDQKTAGQWKGREDEWRQLEQDIYAAHREKRVKG